MSDAIDRARDIIERYLPAMPDQQAAFVTRDAARALDAAGLLVSPERDEERAVGSPAVAKPPVSREDVEAVLKLAYKGTSDMDREPNWLGRVRRWARDGAPFPTVESTPEPASPERDAAVAALPLPGDGCACTPHAQDAGGGYTEYLLEYEPACPEHSEHLWDPKQGVWVLRSEHDAEVAEKAWDEGYSCMRAACEGSWRAAEMAASGRLRSATPRRTIKLEREAGEPDADT